MTATIGIDELRATADLQARRDRKYLLDATQVPHVVGALGLDLRVLEIEGRRTFHYATTYFDTPGLALFHQAAQRRPARAKVRIRTYCDSGEAALEVKTRRPRALTLKDRHPFEDVIGDAIARPWSAREQAWVRSHDILDDPTAPLAPSLVARYRRTTFLVPGSSSRLTIDVDLQFVDPRAHAPNAGPPLHLPDLAILETKSPGPPTDVDHALWRLGHRPSRVSKYGTGLAALRPDLPANPWHRTLARHFTCAGHDPSLANRTRPQHQVR